MTKAGDAVIALSGGIDRVCLFLAKTALVGMVCVIMLQVVSRYGLRQPPVWTEELARYLMVWGGLLGATAAFRRAADPAVVWIDENARDRSALLAKLAIGLTAIIFVGPILYYSLFGAGMDLARSFLIRMSARTSPGLGLNLVFIAAAIPTVCIVILIHLAARIVGGPIRRG
ncbi:TRAP transporter small permease subunit [Aquamicrobium sp. LC103]|uniref:TRAP transporter small permease n=1 Tax=Aquamicrobium sp. LC103 TaxID=1120658 RepID=UPI00063E7C3C|nr:TRAP transporter small permease subunit [Aquamicrobium sp. LC103]TKT69244.1 TRAP transporter small permease subunit [Aquamicrobium sp. LC103]